VTRRFCLIGEHAGESLSPAMQNAAFEARGIDAVYEASDVLPDRLPAILGELRAGVLHGCNVTMPYKAALAPACDWLTGDADVLGAVNTIVVEGGRLIGDNTDAAGFELALSVHGMWPRAGCTMLVLGAGGTAAAVTLALARAPAARFIVVARRPDAARAMAERVAADVPVEVLAWDDSDVQRFANGADIVVNATPLGVAHLPLRVHDLPLSCTVADVRYRPRPLDLVDAARHAGLRACDGLEMLLQQGMLSFERWTGEAPPWDAARGALYEAADA
jgi:shikimate dehydrogenase